MFAYGREERHDRSGRVPGGNSLKLGVRLSDQ